MISVYSLVFISRERRNGEDHMQSLYDDPVDGYPKSYPRADLPNRSLSRRPNVADPEGDRFQTGRMLGSVLGELGLRNI